MHTVKASDGQHRRLTLEVAERRKKERKERSFWDVAPMPKFSEKNIIVVYLEKIRRIGHK